MYATFLRVGPNTQKRRDTTLVMMVQATVMGPSWVLTSRLKGTRKRMKQRRQTPDGDISMQLCVGCHSPLGNIWKLCIFNHSFTIYCIYWNLTQQWNHQVYWHNLWKLQLLAIAVSTVREKIKWPFFKWSFCYCRSLFQVLALLIFIYRKKYTLFGFDDWRTKVKVICQAVIGGGILFSVFEAIGRLPIGDFSAIAFSSPVFTMILSSFILHEKCGFYRVSVGALLIVGVVVLTRPSMTFDTSSSQMTPFSKNITTIDPQNEIETRVVPPLDTNLHKSDIIGIFFAVLTAVLSAAISILAR